MTPEACNPGWPIGGITAADCFPGTDSAIPSALNKNVQDEWMNEHRNKRHALTETLGAAPFSRKYLTTLHCFLTTQQVKNQQTFPTNTPDTAQRLSIFLRHSSAPQFICRKSCVSLLTNLIRQNGEERALLKPPTILGLCFLSHLFFSPNTELLNYFLKT